MCNEGKVLPMSGIDAAAGGVLSVNNSSRRKNATNIFIPANNDIITFKMLIKTRTEAENKWTVNEFLGPC